MNRYFGVGCYYFYPNERFGNRFTMEAYAAALTKTLEASDTITNINVEIDKNFNDDPINLDFDCNPESSFVFYPALHGLNIKFDVNLIERKQEQYMRGLNDTPAVYSEHFRVEIHEGYLSPVTTVEVIQPTKFPMPNEAVVLVREHLSQILTDEFGISFYCLGPSPLPFDLFIVDEDEIPDLPPALSEYVSSKLSNELVVEMLRRPEIGYDDIVFVVASGLSSEDSKAYHDSIFIDLVTQCSELYEVSMRRLKLLKELSELSVMFDKAHAYEQSPFYKRNPFVSHDRRLNELVVTASGASYQLSVFGQKASQSIRQCERDLSFCFISQEIENQIDEMKALPVAEMRDTISFFTENMRHRQASSANLFASIMGGIVGALATLAATNFFG